VEATGTPYPLNKPNRPMRFAKKDILDMESLSVEEIQAVLHTAESVKEISTRAIKKVPTLRGKTIIHFFYEPSTRTRTSFEIAAKRLSADTVSISASSSSIAKGETLVDTARNLEAMSPDVIVVRHHAAGTPHMLARLMRASVINAGDGMHAHPTQTLLDMMTIREKKGRLAGLTIAIIGDVAHSRVARSNIVGFIKMGAKVVLAGPPTMIPMGVETLGALVRYHVREAIKNADVIIVLRIQKERQQVSLFPSEREYAQCYGLTVEKLAGAKEDVLIMHPGPINRGIEIAPEVADGPYSVILEQVANGLAIRMALLYLLLGGSR
jgi:aspartate carbamoyltransferase catalytic subunit